MGNAGGAKAPISMPLDHYVSQVHLKNFYSPLLGELMYAFRKSDSKKFPTKAQDVCRITDHNTNPFLQQPRVIEDFLVVREESSFTLWLILAAARLRSG